MKQNSGFTLIELLVVVLIIGILTAVALPQYTTAVEKSRAAEALTLMSAVAGAAERYQLQKDTWPDSFTKLDLEVPLISGTVDQYGGKSFVMTMGSPNTNTFVVTATRRLDSGKYALKTVITLQSNGTFTKVRNCGVTFDTSATNATASGEAAKYCYAVSGGRPTDF